MFKFINQPLKAVLLTICILFVSFLFSIYFIFVNYLTGIVSVLQYKYLPTQIDHTKYQFSKYILTWGNATISAANKHALFKIHFTSLSIVLTFTLVIGIGLYLYLKATFFKKNNSQKIHGNANFANINEIKQANLLQQNTNKPSIILGKFNKQLLQFNQSKFVALAAPTRSGKGIGVVIPNLLHWCSSLICLDIKGENFQKTSGYRAKFSQVFKFDPFSQETHSYNPLSYISRNNFTTISDIQTIARILWPVNDSDPIWNDSSCTLFQGLVLYLLDLENYLGNNQTITLYEVFNLANKISPYSMQSWQTLQKDLNFLSTRAKTSLNSYFSLPQETKTSVLGTFNAQMQMFTNPSVIAATSHDDFNLANIRKEKMSIYVCVAPNRLSQASKLLNIFFSQLIQINTEELPEQNEKLKETALILLDEFTALGKVDIIEKAISYIAGYGLRLLLIYQSQSQLSGVYGEESARNIVTNCGCQILFAPREQQDAEEYSKMLGNTTINLENYSYNKGGKDSSGKNISINQHERALMLPQELKQMGNDTQIIILEDCKPIKAEKIKYYQDKEFTYKLIPQIEIEKIDIKDEWLGVETNARQINQKQESAIENTNDNIFGVKF